MTLRSFVRRRRELLPKQSEYRKDQHSAYHRQKYLESLWTDPQNPFLTKHRYDRRNVQEKRILRTAHLGETRVQKWCHDRHHEQSNKHCRTPESSLPPGPPPHQTNTEYEGKQLKLTGQKILYRCTSHLTGEHERRVSEQE